LRLSIVHPRELTPSDLTRWESYTSADSRLAGPFLTPTFAQVIGRHRAEARVAVLDDSEQIAYLPFEADRERVGHLFGGGLSDQQALIAPSGFECELPALVRRLQVRELRFDHLVGPLEPFETYVRSRHSSLVIDVSRGYAAYERERAAASGVLRKTASKRRRLVRELGEVEVMWDSPDPEHLALLVRWKEEQYRRTGVRDVFADPWVLDVLRELRAMDHPDCRTRLAVLRADGRVVALHLGLARAGVLASWFPAYDPDCYAFSPGNVLLQAMAEMAPQHGTESIDLGRGTQEYKERFANAGYEVAEGRVPAHGGAFRATVLVRHPGWLGRRMRRVRRG
jgi:CelD/BcsL family acetyltransferase involved in cellulose biosynthesis